MNIPLFEDKQTLSYLAATSGRIHMWKWMRTSMTIQVRLSQALVFTKSYYFNLFFILNFG